MGLFSWITADTNRSIACSGSSRRTFTVHMTAPDGRQWREDNYEGYGEFGGKDIYELIAELNGEVDREDGISMVFENNPSGDFDTTEGNLILPTLTEAKDNPFAFGLPKNCPDQGFFYNDDSYDDDFYDDDSYDDEW